MTVYTLNAETPSLLPPSDSQNAGRLADILKAAEWRWLPWVIPLALEKRVRSPTKGLLFCEQHMYTASNLLFSEYEWTGKDYET